MIYLNRSCKTEFYHIYETFSFPHQLLLHQIYQGEREVFCQPYFSTMHIKKSKTNYYYAVIVYSFIAMFSICPSQHWFIYFNDATNYSSENCKSSSSGGTRPLGEVWILHTLWNIFDSCAKLMECGIRLNHFSPALTWFNEKCVFRKLLCFYNWIFRLYFNSHFPPLALLHFNFITEQ